MTSLDSLVAVVKAATEADDEMIKTKKTFSQKSRSWNNIFWILTLDCGPPSISLLDCELSVLFVAGITLRSLAPFTRNNSKRETVWL